MKLLNQVDVVARRLRLADAARKVYSSWIEQYLRFSAGLQGRWVHPAKLGTADVVAFLNDLVGRRRLSAAAQNQSAGHAIACRTNVRSHDRAQRSPSWGTLLRAVNWRVGAGAARHSVSYATADMTAGSLAALRRAAGGLRWAAEFGGEAGGVFGVEVKD